MGMAGPGFVVKKGEKWSGRRGSNPRPSAWEADALPAELLPLGRARSLARAPVHQMNPARASHRNAT